ncbi:RNA methylase family UPF0020 protein [Toxoplasma gondii ARI]|uniref:RNA methylase family UPF0020 protein n=1 Tax=Toxoplasma gondii ARI TaxID=1074872 RepID=A0A139XR68_TOXGO|nr:RNA methylase family UPF0020 protein [Toxoplasma gondii ARI]
MAVRSRDLSTCRAKFVRHAVSQSVASLFSVVPSVSTAGAFFLPVPVRLLPPPESRRCIHCRAPSADSSSRRQLLVRTALPVAQEKPGEAASRGQVTERLPCELQKGPHIPHSQTAFVSNSRGISACSFCQRPVGCFPTSVSFLKGSATAEAPLQRLLLMRWHQRMALSSARIQLNGLVGAEQQLSSDRKVELQKTKRRDRRPSTPRNGEESEMSTRGSAAAERAFAVLRARLAGRQRETTVSQPAENSDSHRAISGLGQHYTDSTSSYSVDSSGLSSKRSDAVFGVDALQSVSTEPGVSDCLADDSSEEDESLLKIFCVCAPGLEGVLARELLSLRLPAPPLFSAEACDAVSSGDPRSDEKVRLQEAALSAAAAAAEAANRLILNGTVDGKYRGSGGGIEVTGTLETLWNICMRSRLTDAVRVRVGSPFPAQRETTLLRRLCALPWQKFVPLVADLGEPVVSVRVRRSRLHHTKMLEEMTSAALKENKKKFLQDSKRDGLPPHMRGRGVTMSGPHLHVTMRDGVCQVSIDAGGDIGKRPWRVSRGPMPLKEPLAAAVAYRTPFLNLLFENKKLFVWDPFCGTGPILLEMLGIAGGIPSNTPRRRHAFFDFPIHSPSRFAAFLDCIRLSPHPNLQNLELFGSDIDLDQIKRAQKNLNAFVERLPRTTEAVVNGESDGKLPCKIDFTVGSFLQVSSGIPPGAFIVTNLPYGRRSDRETIDSVYRDFRRMIAARDDWAGVYVLSASKKFKADGGLNWRAISRFSNGGIEVELLKYLGKKQQKVTARC